MGRLSTFAKNRILNLRFQKSYRIKQIANALFQEDNIKVSRKSISTFLKKYIETKSINDKPRSGRNKKLTPEEINLIGEVTRLNRDITAPKIKEYLNLNVSTYTILRASKLFEWNKLNPNSNEAKKAAALERQMNGETKKKRASKKRSLNKSSNSNTSICSDQSDSNENIKNEPNTKEHHPAFPELPPDANLNLIPESEVLLAKNVSSSPMVFATKILYKIFKLDELIGHNVSGKTFNKYIKNKKALDEKRINYIRWLVEKHFETQNKEELWKSCRTAINKSIRNNEIKFANAAGIPANNLIVLQQHTQQAEFCNLLNRDLNNNSISLNNSNINNSSNSSSSSSSNNNNNNNNNTDNTINSATNEQLNTGNTTIINLQPNLSIFQITNDLPPPNELDDLNTNNTEPQTTSIIRLTDTPDLSAEFIQEDNKIYLDLSKSAKIDEEEMVYDSENNQEVVEDEEDDEAEYIDSTSDDHKLSILSENEIIELKNLCCCSPMIFATKVLLKIFSKNELIGHNVSGKTFHKTLKNKQPLDEERIDYIRHLVEKYFPNKNIETVWKSCRKAINRVIRNFEIKESKLIKSIEDDLIGDTDTCLNDSKSNDDSIEMFNENLISNSTKLDERSSDSFNINNINN